MTARKPIPPKTRKQKHKTKGTNMEFQLTDAQTEDLLERIVVHTSDTLRRDIGERVATVVEKRTKELADKIIVEKLTPAIDEILNEGWQPTDTYGCEKGPRQTLKNRLEDVLLKRGGYNRPSIEKMADEAINKQLKGDMQAIVRKIRAELNAAIDEAYTDKLRATIKEAVGLRR